MKTQIDKKLILKLKKGISYDTVKDRYIFSSSFPEKLGPISLGLQVTRRCNASCLHCAASEMTSELNTEEMLILINEIHKGGCVRLSVTGGEPMVRDDIRVILKKIHSLGMASTLSTNGLLLNKKRINQVAPFISNIRFSLHGMEETNDHIFQKKGAFKKISKVIDQSIGIGLPVGVIFSVMRSNVNELVDVATWLNQKGVDKLIIFTLIANGRGRDIFDTEFLHVSEVNSVMRVLENRKRQEGWSISYNLVDWRIEGQCLLVKPNGDLYGAPCFKKDCRRDNTLKLGNILQKSLSMLWEEYIFKQNYIDYYRNH